MPLRERSVPGPSPNPVPEPRTREPCFRAERSAVPPFRSAVIVVPSVPPSTRSPPVTRSDPRPLGAPIRGNPRSRFSRREPLTENDLRELLDEYETWLRHAAAQQKSLVFFYH